MHGTVESQPSLEQGLALFMVSCFPHSNNACRPVWNEKLHAKGSKNFKGSLKEQLMLVAAVHACS